MAGELVRYGAKLARASRKPNLISPELLAKDDISLRDKLWVYNEVVTAALIAPVWVLSLLWLEYPLTMQGWAKFFIVTTSIALICCLIEFLIRSGNNSDPLKANQKTDVLSHAGRKRLCQIDRARRRTHFNHEYSNYNLKGNQYSVWIDHEGANLVITLVEHLPTGGRRMWPTVYQRSVTQTKKVPTYDTYDEWGGRPRKLNEPIHYTTMNQEEIVPAVRRLSAPTIEEAAEAIEEVKQMAGALEEQAAKLKYDRMDAKRMAMILRN